MYKRKETHRLLAERVFFAVAKLHFDCGFGEELSREQMALEHAARLLDPLQLAILSSSCIFRAQSQKLNLTKNVNIYSNI